MPLLQSFPSWTTWNSANFPTPSGLQDVRTGQDYAAGGLNLGDYFDATEKEANSASAYGVGLLHNGRYRLVHVDSGATAANVKTGTVGYLRAGTTMQGVIVTVPGTAATPGNYTIAATPGSGGGAGAVIQVAVGSTGVITSAAVLQGGANYVTVPTFSLTVTGTTGGVVVAQLNSSPNEVTSYDQATTMATLVRPVVFLNSITPGNYGFVQELGLATVLGGAGATGNPGDWVNSAALGVVATTAGSGSPIGATIGQAIDKAAANQLFKCYLTEAGVFQD